jgi:catalase
MSGVYKASHSTFTGFLIFPTSKPIAMCAKSSKSSDKNIKREQLEKYTKDPKGKVLTTRQGAKVNDTNNSLKAGKRGPTLLEDFLLREKITSFDHERIPERIVHARGSGAHGYFEL